MAKSVTVHYRRAVTDQFANIDFRARYEGGLNGQINGVRLGDVDAARVTVSSDNRRMCLLSPIVTEHYCFGEIAVFREGDVPVAEMTDAGAVQLRTIELEGNEEAIRGSSYFMARGPHLAIINHESTSRFVEEYLRWLFRQPIGEMGAGALVSLTPVILAEGEAVALHNVKSLKFKAEVELLPGQVAAAFDQAPAHDDRHSFRRMIERRPLSVGDMKTILRAIGMTNGSLGDLNDQQLQDVEFELLMKKREGNRLTALPDALVAGVISDGLDQAAEFQTDGARRRGDGIVASYGAEVEIDGAYFELASVRAALWAALTQWSEDELI